MFNKFFGELFGSREPNLTDVKVKLRTAERDRIKQFEEVRKLDAKQAQLLTDIRKSMRDGNKLQVDYLYDELKFIKHDIGLATKTARIANRQTMVLKRVMRAMESRTRTGDKDSVRKMIERLVNSDIASMIAKSDVSDEEYTAKLDEILGMTELETGGTMEADDPEKEKLLSALSAINEAEDAGNFDEATEKEREVKRLLESEDKNRA
jgi:hypothetical protein